MENLQVLKTHSTNRTNWTETLWQNVSSDVLYSVLNNDCFKRFLNLSHMKQHVMRKKITRNMTLHRFLLCIRHYLCHITQITYHLWKIIRYMLFYKMVFTCFTRYDLAKYGLNTYLTLFYVCCFMLLHVSTCCLFCLADYIC